jgi:hypothetical protein
MSGPSSIPTPPELEADGIVGETIFPSKNGVFGRNDSDALAQEPGGNGVFGFTVSPGGNGVFGANNHPTKGRGVQGNGPEAGVGGFSDGGNGVFGESSKGDGVFGQSHADERSGVVGISYAKGNGVYGRAGVGGNAGCFDGNVQINGIVTIASGGDITFADFSEEFDITVTADVEPGTVMILDQCGALEPSQQAYDKKVAGVISGGGNYKPGLILDKKESSEGRLPVALVGKVYCKVDAQYAPIEVGDLLTTSPTPGHAMKADDPFKAFGSVIGKALRPLETGQGMIPILIALQ